MGCHWSDEVAEHMVAACWTAMVMAKLDAVRHDVETGLSSGVMV